MGLRKCNLEDEFINCSLIDEYAFTSMFALYGVIDNELIASLSMDESSFMATFMLYTLLFMRPANQRVMGKLLRALILFIRKKL